MVILEQVYFRKETYMEQNETHDIYTISFNGQVIYVGKTTKGYHRWTCHKTKARQANIHSRYIHDFMRENTSDPETFPEFEYNVICKCFDEDIADSLEKHFQSIHEVPNRYTRPLQFSDNIERRGE